MNGEKAKAAPWRAPDFFRVPSVCLPQTVEVDIPSLARVGLGALLWSNYASNFLFYHSLTISSFVVSLLFFTLTTALFVGWQTRVSAFLLGTLLLLLRLYGQNLPQSSVFKHHHYSLITLATLYLALIPCGVKFSIDGLKKERATREWTGHWSLPILQALLSSVYLYAAIGKLGAGCLDGTRLEIQFVHLYSGSISTPQWLKAMGMVSTWITVIAEITFAIGVWLRASIRLLFIPAMLMHLLMYLVLPVQTFSLLMVLLWSLLLSGTTIVPLRQERGLKANADQLALDRRCQG